MATSKATSKAKSKSKSTAKPKATSKVKSKSKSTAKSKTSKAKPKAKAEAAKAATSSSPAVAASWATIDAWFAARPEFQPALRPGASEAAIAAAERTLGVRFPDDFRTSLAIHDGQDDTTNCEWLPVAHRLGSLAALVACWKDDRENYDEDEDQGFDDDEKVNITFDHPKHIPIAGSQYWDYDRLLLDLAPGPEGKMGQVIGRIDIEIEVVAPSFAAFLAKVAKELGKRVALVE